MIDVNDPVVVEPVVNLEKLRELLAWETEYPSLDFKSTCDPNEQRALVELAKDVGAMSVRGGYLVIGVDKRGKPTREVTARHAPLFDEARLRPKLLKYLPDTLRISCQDHDLPDGLVILVHVAANPAGCAFFRADGQYADPSTNKSTTVFREGEAFHRDGTQSRRLNQRGFEEIIEQRVLRARHQWQQEHAAEAQRLAENLLAGAAADRATVGSAVGYTVDLDPDVLVEATVELLRRNDDIPLRRLLTKAAVAARTCYRVGDQAGLEDILDQLARLAATCLDLDRPEWLNRILDTLAAVYDVALEDEPAIIDQPPKPAATLWLAIVQRVEALGGLAVRRAAWAAVRRLVTQRPSLLPDPYATWLRHATTMANRAALVPAPGAAKTSVPMISLARDVARRLENLHPGLDSDDERILTSINQFDFLACVASLDTAHGCQPGGGFYPHFATFYGTRTNPIAERLVADPDLRAQLYAGGDEELARALVRIDAVAREAAFRYDGWEGYTEPVLQFIRNNS